MSPRAVSKRIELSKNGTIPNLEFSETSVEEQTSRRVDDDEDEDEEAEAGERQTDQKGRRLLFYLKSFHRFIPSEHFFSKLVFYRFQLTKSPHSKAPTSRSCCGEAFVSPPPSITTTAQGTTFRTSLPLTTLIKQWRLQIQRKK